MLHDLATPTPRPASASRASRTSPTTRCRPLTDPGFISTLPESTRIEERERRLAEHIAPALRRADVGIAEPELVFERLAAGRPFEPEQRRDDGRVAPDTDGLLQFVLPLVDRRACAGLFEQVLFRKYFPPARHQHEVVGEDARHRRRVVNLHGLLVSRVEFGHRLFDLFDGRSRLMRVHLCLPVWRLFRPRASLGADAQGDGQEAENDRTYRNEI